MILAYRYYRLKAEAPFLQSISCWSTVDGPVVVATCSGQEWNMIQEKVPHENCSCGIYAVKNIRGFEGYIARSRFSNSRPKAWFSLWTYRPLYSKPKMSALVTIGLFGRIIEHENGYRAERGIIKHIVLLTAGRQFTRNFMRKIGDYYETDVEQNVVKSLVA